MRRLPIVLRCNDALVHRARYVFDTLLMARRIPVVYAEDPPSDGPWLLYAPKEELCDARERRCVAIAHFAEAWDFSRQREDEQASFHGELAVVSPECVDAPESEATISFDLIANAFYFLSSWSERRAQEETDSRALYSRSVFRRRGVPQDIVDQYLDRLMEALDIACWRAGVEPWPDPVWPGSSEYGVVLSHDIDFVPSGFLDTARQGAKTLLRHLIRERDVFEALRAAKGWVGGVLRGRDVYGCVPHIIDVERQSGVMSSFQVAVGHMHPNDVNYRIEDEAVLAYLRRIVEAGFEVCLHGSYRSTEVPEWYIREVELLTRTLGRPLGSRQHFLSFGYDALFGAQERAGIEYDMSMGFPDRAGARAGFSYPYFPYSLADDRPYDVVEIALFYMDVTLRSYMGLKAGRAWEFLESELARLKRKRGFVSVVWHPIVFGGARDPGYDTLFWKLIDYVRSTNGLGTDGRTINAYWRDNARQYSSFTKRTAVASSGAAV
ncbi:MAG TPA: polysaccharide deacetylase family protein [Gammaproteobacteria bacterium]